VPVVATKGGSDAWVLVKDENDAPELEGLRCDGMVRIKVVEDLHLLFVQLTVRMASEWFASFEEEDSGFQYQMRNKNGEWDGQWKNVQRRVEILNRINWHHW
jgi:hypothetical protein